MVGATQKEAVKKGRRASKGKAKRRTTIQEVVRYSLSHHLRVYSLILLNEGEYSVAEMAEIMDVDVKLLSNHIGEMVDDGAIELVRAEPVRGSIRHIYRAVQMPYYSDEDLEKMTPEQRQVTVGLATQSMLAEILAGLEAGKMHGDPRVHVFWNWFNVDEQGRQAIADVLASSSKQVEAIEVETANRVAMSGAETQSILVTQTGFERARKGPFRGPVLPPDSD